eukprot:692727-Prymnesium_polylepis.1
MACRWAAERRVLKNDPTRRSRSRRPERSTPRPPHRRHHVLSRPSARSISSLSPSPSRTRTTAGSTATTSEG